MAANIMKPPVEGGAPPAPPFDLPSFNADEGPMRAELRRQIAALEGELARIVAQYCPWEPREVNTTRGPAVQSGHALEEIRDELLTSLHKLCRRIESEIDGSQQGAVLEAEAAEPADGDTEGSDSSGRAPWRRLTRR